MNKENYSSKQKGSKQKNGDRIKMLVLSLLLIVGISIGITLAYLNTKTEAEKNTFKPSYVDCEVTENFNGAEKTNVNVKNTSDIDAYIRVKLVTYRVNSDGERIGGLATIPSFTPGTDWVLHDGYYYYTKTVAASEQPATDLINTIALESNYSDADGGKQVIEVMAEAIQATGTDSSGKTPIELSWGINPTTWN